MTTRIKIMENNDIGDYLDRTIMRNLHSLVGPTVFNELMEDAIFETTERIARIEQLSEASDLDAIAPIAHDLVAIAGQVGMSGVSEIATALERCCLDHDSIAARAVAQRMVRVGESSLVAAAEMGGELSAKAAGKRAG